jgi:hypothetical protein
VFHKELPSNYKKNVGDIEFDLSIDDSSFVIGSKKVVQYYNFGKGVNFKGDNIAIDEYFRENYISPSIPSETGYITIRFIVNTLGKSGWFRVQEMDTNYEYKPFHKSITEQVLALTKKLDEWIVGEIDGKKYAYYQYLTFKIQDGSIIEILP